MDDGAVEVSRPARPEKYDAVGRSIRTWWEDGNGGGGFFEAIVYNYDSTSNKHMARYLADGALESINVLDQDVTFLDEGFNANRNSYLWKLFLAEAEAGAPLPPSNPLEIYIKHTKKSLLSPTPTGEQERKLTQYACENFSKISSQEREAYETQAAHDHQRFSKEFDAYFKAVHGRLPPNNLLRKEKVEKKNLKLKLVVKRTKPKPPKSSGEPSRKRRKPSQPTGVKKEPAKKMPSVLLHPPRPEGPYALGHRVEVYWAGDKRFYPGKIVKFNAETSMHTVRYEEDGNKEEIDLEDTKINFFVKSQEEEDELQWQRYFAKLHSKRVPFERPRNAFQLYCRKNTEFLKQTYPALPLQKAAGKHWKQVSADARLPLEEEARANMVVYNQKLEAYLKAMPRGGYPPLPPKEIPLKVWHTERLKHARPEWRGPMTSLFKRGFAVFENVLSHAVMDLLLDGPKEKETTPDTHSNSEEEQENRCNGRRVLRKRSAMQTWHGAKATIAAHIDRRSSGQITIKAPLCTRSSGRYDMPLTNDVASPIFMSLQKAGLIDFVQFLLSNRGTIRTQNIMLSEPGSQRQPIHTDSNWDRHCKRDPKPHYYTILIPFVDQNKFTGGTMLYPETHRTTKLAAVEDGGSVKGIEPPQKAGNALVFDGLLQHRGTENVSGEEGKGDPVDRYFYYMAICIGKDPNTYVTGYGGKRQQSRR